MSEIAVFMLLWVCVIALGVVVLGLARQVGVLHQRLGPAGALMLSQSAKVGEKSPEFDLVGLDGQALEIGKKAADGRSTLLMFVSPDCPVCDQLMPALKSIGAAEARSVRLLFASDGEPAAHRAFREKKGLAEFPYVLSGQLGMTYQIGKLPYAVLLDEHGVVASQGLCNSREHVESLFEARRLGVRSLQDYLAQTDKPPRTAAAT
jgi:methylamine dehydrogenase accessory protein MauD